MVSLVIEIIESADKTVNKPAREQESVKAHKKCKKGKKEREKKQIKIHFRLRCLNPMLFQALHSLERVDYASRSF
jgi:hypothetical protein